MILCSSLAASRILQLRTHSAYVSFSRSSPCSATHLKLKHSFTKLNITSHFYLHRLPRLWNLLPTVNHDLPISTIRKIVILFFWIILCPTFKVTIHAPFVISAHVLDVCVCQLSLHVHLHNTIYI